MSTAEIRQHPRCFGCGPDNPIGLRLDLRLEGDRLETQFTPCEEHGGWPGIVHGGIITGLLYEVMENLPYLQGETTMMKTMETRFRRPARTSETIAAAAWLDERYGRTMRVSAELTGSLGGRDRLIAQGSALLVVLSGGEQARLGITQPEEAHSDGIQL